MTEPVTYPAASDAARAAANKRKREFLAFFETRGGRYALNNRSKPYLGELSPGCRICAQGKWSCVYLNGLCTRNCFYCPQDRAIDTEPPACTDDGLYFKETRDYIAYAGRFACEGIGFSGGEPFLAFDRLLEYVRSARRTFGPGLHLWAYTNGDRVTKERLTRLKEAGINELRFNISANSYDLRAVILAVRQIDIVTVEIPAIPEDADLVKARLPEMEAAGVKYLNLHQLLMNEFNHRQLKERGYTVTHAGRYLHGQPVIESELAAFDLVEHAARLGIRMGVNYCSRCYKARFQERAYRKRHAFLFGIPDGAITSTGYLRTISAEMSEDGREKLLAHLQNSGRTDFPLSKARTGDRVEFPADLLPAVLAATPGQAVTVAYADPILKPADPAGTDPSGIKVFGENNLALAREPIREFQLENPSSLHFFHALFVEGRSRDETAVEAAGYFGVPADRQERLRQDVEDFSALFEGVEYVSADLPDYD